MSFHEKLERYRDGTATPEEAAEIKAALEQREALDDYYESQLEPPVPADLAPAERADVKRIVRRVNRRLALTAAVSVLLVILLAVAAVLFCDLYYYNPNKGIPSLYGNDYGQFMIDMSVFTEVNSPGFDTMSALAERDGPGCYNIRIQQRSTLTGRNESYTGRIVRGKLSDAPSGSLREYWRFPIANAFGWRQGVIARVDEDGKEQFEQPPDSKTQIVQDLRNLPKSCIVSACFTFRESMTLDELARLRDDWTHRANWFSIDYAAVEIGSTSNNVIGFNPGTGGILMENTPDEAYPYLDLGRHYEELQQDAPKVWQAHLQSLLRYLSDRPRFLETMADVNGLGVRFYQKALEHVEKNGVNVYGILVSGNVDDVLLFAQQNDYYSIWVDEVVLSPLGR